MPCCHLLVTNLKTHLLYMFILFVAVGFSLPFRFCSLFFILGLKKKVLKEMLLCFVNFYSIDQWALYMLLLDPRHLIFISS